MTPAEQGFLLLTCSLADPARKPLTTPQLRNLAQRVKAAPRFSPDQQLQETHLVEMGYDRDSARHILELLSQEQQLQWYLRRAGQAGCVPITRASRDYPQCLTRNLGDERPGILWAKGDPALLQLPAVALVGSRRILPENLDFARQAGEQAAKQGFALISGNAKGADSAAQESCLEQGGYVISVVADRLDAHKARDRVLYLSEEDFDAPFTPARALRRNRVIHALASRVLVAQATLGKGGTWEGTRQNLRYGWSPVFCFDDGSQACRELSQMGAQLISTGQLSRLSQLQAATASFL